MGGKSTYMRQGALIVLLAHIGSFVPAERAVLGPIDRVFTRIGAGDDLAGGRSTFMVEMTEAANILNNATDKSLILMDEIGRGTSTFDGLSLAWAVARHIARVNRSFTLFATHYFELTNLANEIEGCANVHLDATEHRDGIVFLHAVKEGPASRSYGLAVAQLAGVPREVIAAAREYLAALESGAAHTTPGAAAMPAPRGRRTAAAHAAGPTTARAPAPAASRSAPAGTRSRAARSQRRRSHAARRAGSDLPTAGAAQIGWESTVAQGCALNSPCSRKFATWRATSPETSMPMWLTGSARCALWPGSLVSLTATVPSLGFVEAREEAPESHGPRTGDDPELALAVPVARIAVARRSSSATSGPITRRSHGCRATARAERLSDHRASPGTPRARHARSARARSSGTTPRHRGCARRSGCDRRRCPSTKRVELRERRGHRTAHGRIAEAVRFEAVGRAEPPAQQRELRTVQA